MRLAAGMELELELRMPVPETCEQRLDVWRVGPGQKRHHHASLCQERLCDLAGHLVELVSPRQCLARDEAEPRALAQGETVELGVTGRDGDLAGDDGLQHFR